MPRKYVDVSASDAAFLPTLTSGKYHITAYRLQAAGAVDIKFQLISDSTNLDICLGGAAATPVCHDPANSPIEGKEADGIKLTLSSGVRVVGFVEYSVR